MARLGEVSHSASFEQFPPVKAAELEGVRFSIVNARGPYVPKSGDGEFIVFTVALAETGEVRDLLLSNKGTQRADVLAHFADEEADPITPVTIRPLPIEGRPLPMWVFADPDEAPAETEEPANGNGKHGKSKSK